MRTSSLLVAGVLCTALFASGEAWAQKGRGEGGLQLRSGTKQLGGQLSFSTSAGIPLESGNPTTSYQLNIAPTFGIFAARNFELQVGMNYSMSFGDNSEYSSKLLGVDLGGRYCIDAYLFFVYLGLNFGLDLVFPPESTSGVSQTNILFSWGVPIGLLLPFNRWVALDVGLRINFSKNITDGAPNRLSVAVPVGYMGVQAFF